MSNADHAKAYMAAWRRQNRSKVLAYNAAWAQKNPGRVKALRRASNLRYYLKRQMAQGKGTSR